MIKKNLNLRSRSSYNKFLLSEDKKEISKTLRQFGYYFSNIDPSSIYIKPGSTSSKQCFNFA